MSLLAFCATLVRLLPVMTSARAPCPARPFAGARRILQPLQFPRPAHAPAFRDNIGSGQPSCAPWAARCNAKKARISRFAWFGRVDCVGPGHDDLRLST